MDIATDPHAHLRAAFDAGCRIQAWHLNDGAANSNDGRWDTLMPPEGREPEFGCAPHLYRVHPDDAAILATALEQAPVAPEGWALVPQQMALTPEARGLIETMCAGPDNEGIGGEGGEDRWCDGILWVGETIGDNGEKYWGLNIANSECVDEGSVPVCEFARPTSARLCAFFADVDEVEQFMDELCNIVTELTGDEGDEDPITVLRRHIDNTPAHTPGARDAVNEEAIVALVAGPYMYHHKMDDHAIREGKAFDRCRELTIQNVRTFFATRNACDAAMRQEVGANG